MEPTAAALVDRLRELTTRLEGLLAEIPGALVEPKGLTTSVHYRNVPPEHRDHLARIVHETVEPDTTRFVLTAAMPCGRSARVFAGTREMHSYG